MKSILKYLRIAIFPVMMAQMILHVRADEVFTLAQIHAMAIGNLQIDVDQETEQVNLALQLKRTTSLSDPQWESVSLSSTDVNVDETGVIHITTEATADAAFYKIVASETDIEPSVIATNWITETLQNNCGYLTYQPIPGSVQMNSSGVDMGNGIIISSSSSNYGVIDYFSGLYGTTNAVSNPTFTYATTGTETNNLPFVTEVFNGNSGKLSKTPISGTVLFVVNWGRSPFSWTHVSYSYYGYVDQNGSINFGGKMVETTSTSSGNMTTESWSTDLSGTMNSFGAFVLSKEGNITVTYVPAE